MRLQFSLLMVCICLFFSCNSAGGEKYFIDGSLANGKDKTIFLEKLALNKISVIDSVKTDNAGKFKLSNVAEKGFYRLRVDNKLWMILMDNKKYTIQMDYNVPIQYTITGSPESAEFKEAIDEVAAFQIKYGAMNEAFHKMQNEGKSQDTLQQFAAMLQAQGQQFEQGIAAKVKTAKDPFVALYRMSMIQNNGSPELSKSVIERMMKEAPKSSYTAELKTQYDAMEAQLKAQAEEKKSASSTQEGAIAPDLEFANPEGKKIKLSSLRGKVVLLDFWASWCGPCRRENPAVVQAYNQFKDKGFDIYSVSLDQDGAKWKAAIQQDGLIWPNHVSDLKGWQSEAAAKYGVRGIPAQFLLDAQGKIIAKNLRGEELSNKLKEILK